MQKFNAVLVGVFLYSAVFAAPGLADSARKLNLGLTPAATSADTTRMMLEGRLAAPASKAANRVSVTCSDGLGRTYSQNQREFVKCVKDSQDRVSAPAPALVPPAQPGTATPGPAVNVGFGSGNS